MPRLLASLSCLLLAFAPLSVAQTIAIRSAAGPASLNGPWTMQAGQDPPHQVFLDQKIAFPNPPRDLWFRTAIELTDPLPSPALMIQPVAETCEIYANSAKIADCAQLSGPNADAQRWVLARLPAGSSTAPISVAIHLGNPARSLAGGTGFGPGAVQLGSAPTLAQFRFASDSRAFEWLLPQSLLCVAELLGGLLLLVVFLDDRDRREYIWFAGFLLLDGTCSFESVFQRIYPLFPESVTFLFIAFGQITRYAPLIGFLAAFTRVRVNPWIRSYQWLLVVLPALLYAILLWSRAGLDGFLSTFYGPALLWSQVPFVAGSLLYLLWQARRGNHEATVLIPSFLLANGIEILGLVGIVGRFHVSHFSFNSDDLSMFFFLVSIGPVILMRHRRIGIEHARATAELDAAREIQRRLVPAILPAIPPHSIHAAYIPAHEVGGDFYQLLPRADGSVLIAVGDVSGKGLKAAMTGVLALGALRTLAFEGLDPAAILHRLNQELLRAENDGFVTCLCAVLLPDSTLRLANAGHLPPLLNGAEIEMPGALPLGLASVDDFPQQEFELQPGDRLTFLSDGVVEAQSPTGELFGFDRTAAISTQSAESIAAAAQQFGQEDDITVLTLTFAPSEVLHA